MHVGGTEVSIQLPTPKPLSYPAVQVLPFTLYNRVIVPLVSKFEARINIKNADRK